MMKMRMPAIPLITVDPYFTVWSYDEINTKFPMHWTEKPNSMLGTVYVDGKEYRFLGASDGEAIKQVEIDIDAMSTTVIYENEVIRLTAVFTTPILVTELYYTSRPVSYLKLSYESLDGKEHEVKAKVSVSEEICLNHAGEGRALSEEVAIQNGSAIKMGNGEQRVLSRGDDDIRIDWGYFYLATKGQAKVVTEVFQSLYAVSAEIEMKPDALFVFAYDDILSMVYFEKPLKAYWKKDGKTIEEAIEEALDEYDELTVKCKNFSADLSKKATEMGGEKYAELLNLSYRQIMAAHKLVVDEEGNNLYISKECLSGGMAATVDVTYPSAPMYLYYNPELVKGMLRPIFRYARSEAWKFDFAPHDMGMYPFMNGQFYGENKRESQMPIEECGNMIILMEAICAAENDTSFVIPQLDLMKQWSKYLIEYGCDPEDQLCTDDFAGRSAHNFNLSIKAIMGIVAYSRILERIGEKEEAKWYFEKAKEYVAIVKERAANEDGSYRLAFDRPGSFSLKYNVVWDKLWKTDLFGDEFYRREIERYKKEALPYGVPLDSREKYTKSDWIAWVACLAEDQEEFSFFTDLLWRAYDTTHTRVAMADWYYADTAEGCMFKHRTVQGGLFMRFLFS